MNEYSARGDIEGANYRVGDKDEEKWKESICENDH